tara:strand:- start:266 stop:865 length:600 start_codon:yes stop_codon:yes gene_type:complete
VALDYQATIVASDYKRIIRELNKIEPDLVKELRANLKEVGQTVRTGVRANIPKQPPLSGMRRKLSPVGKTWNTRRNASTVQVKIKSPQRSVNKNQAIVQLVVKSPATIIADMAGRGNAGRTGKTDWYVYPSSTITTDNYRPGMRRHTVNGQGKAMIQKLGGSASRYAYPGAEEKMPEAYQQVVQIMGDAVREIERNVNG